MREKMKKDKIAAKKHGNFDVQIFESSSKSIVNNEKEQLPHKPPLPKPVKPIIKPTPHPLLGNRSISEPELKVDDKELSDSESLSSDSDNNQNINKKDVILPHKVTFVLPPTDINDSDDSKSDDNEELENKEIKNEENEELNKETKSDDDDELDNKEKNNEGIIKIY